MNDEVLVKVDSVSKKFCRSLKRSLWYGLQDIGAEMIGRSNHHNDLRKNEFWAVKDVSFELRRGECLGLIGHNGAGKTTLLRMLNGLIKPDQGQITIRGRVGALIQLGAGFNPILTGRENIYVNGQILGFTKKEIDAKFDAIVDFSEIGEFIDTPVQNYSSGMKVRLGFSVAAQMDPDVLLVDEVLAVGDIGFRTKCFNRIVKLLDNSLVIFVSHSMPQVGRISTKVMYMSNGKEEMFTNESYKAIDLYYNSFKISSENKTNNYTNVINLYGISINNLEYLDEEIIVQHNELLIIKMDLEAFEKISNFKCNIVFHDKDLKAVASTFSDKIQLSNGMNQLKFEMSTILSSGHYNLSFHFIEVKENGLNKNHLICLNRVNLFVEECEVISPSPIILKGKWSHNFS